MSGNDTRTREVTDERNVAKRGRCLRADLSLGGQDVEVVAEHVIWVALRPQFTQPRQRRARESLSKDEPGEGRWDGVVVDAVATLGKCNGIAHATGGCSGLGTLASKAALILTNYTPVTITDRNTGEILGNYLVQRERIYRRNQTKEPRPVDGLFPVSTTSCHAATVTGFSQFDWTNDLNKTTSRRVNSFAR
jgi:hypothetical protein